MDSKRLLSLIKKEEGVKLDFKLKLSLQSEGNKKELAKDVCAIANSRGGRGYIIIGLEDKSKEIIGVNESEIIKEEQVQQIVSSRCEPPIPISVDTCKIQGKRICVITIYSGDQKPYQIRESGAFYIRRGSTTDTMRKQELIEAFEENLDFFMETSTVMKSDISFLDEDLLKQYFKNKGIELNEENKEFLLESSRIAYRERESGKMNCTLGGLLIFSNYNSLWIPQNMIKIINRINKNKDEVIVIQGSILEMVDKSERVIYDLMPNDYPSSAIIEGVKNAVLYRKYSSVNRVIEISIGYKSVSIDSPGALIEKSNLGKEISHSKRNIWIYEKLITLDNNKRFLNNGRGFSRMKKAFYGVGKVKLINSIKDDYFKVILPGVSIYDK
ncbi:MULTISPECIES: helix-turn-helix domain-containing protein [Clostridium]|uniref:AlbA family DNA-binding domain-containing protein n=2 Tax=Clostridiaceae TaxID=31979 RepID=UPI0011593AAF|nr:MULTISPECIES: RNA-binding domain-containing protein [Clostridium]MBS5305043.1 putative DNA binding domain-containing protein [Clostridium sp.]MDB1932317.1 putative DNA binding domain-containing protein [Clostridium tertium]MDB1936469.1 putative DNA binding domain-containing protein [Clostridium tertium]MDB1942951.1 putative DNA binding domain-containing protein [Clostridium tertium]MDB1950052.1 putative DNA binding domain-containing protein [Clostridium tertium]